MLINNYILIPKCTNNIKIFLFKTYFIKFWSFEVNFFFKKIKTKTWYFNFNKNYNFVFYKDKFIFYKYIKIINSNFCRDVIFKKNFIFFFNFKYFINFKYFFYFYYYTKLLYFNKFFNFYYIIFSKGDKYLTLI